MSEPYRIDKNIPIPNGKRKASPLDRAPWAQMEVGDSFYFEAITAAGVHKRAEKAGIKIICREEGAGYRVWRIL